MTKKSYVLNVVKNIGFPRFIIIENVTIAMVQGKLQNK